MSKQQARVLVVDDERNIRKNLCMVVEAAGYAADAARDGDEALGKCRELHYDVAFVDLRMPKMDGLTLLSYLRSQDPNTAVVILTAHGSITDAVDAMKLGAVDFLQKPFDPKKIPLLIEEILLRQKLGSGGSVEDLLHLAQLARERSALVEARAYLKAAMLRDIKHPEPYFWLGLLCESEGDARLAAQYYYMALDSAPSFDRAREALIRLGHLDGTTSA